MHACEGGALKWQKILSCCWAVISGLRDREREERGSVLLTTLALGLCVSVMALTLESLAAEETRIQSLYDASRRAYWLGRGSALVLLSELKNSIPVPAVQTLQIDKASVQETVSLGPIDSVRVTVNLQNAVDTVVFTYNPVSQVVTTWQDNSP